MCQIKSAHSRIRHHFFKSIQIPRGVKKLPKICYKTLRIGSLSLSYFLYIFLCVNLLRQGAEMDLQHQEMNLLPLPFGPVLYAVFFAPKKLKKPPSKAAQKYSKKNSPIAAKTTQREEFLFQNVAYRSTVYKTGPFLL